MLTIITWIEHLLKSVLEGRLQVLNSRVGDGGVNVEFKHFTWLKIPVKQMRKNITLFKLLGVKKRKKFIYFKYFVIYLFILKFEWRDLRTRMKLVTWISSSSWNLAHIASKLCTYFIFVSNTNFSLRLSDL